MARASVLIIDDDRATTECYREVLEEAHLEVATAPNQAASYPILDTEKNFSLILVDHSLKGLESTEFIKALRLRYPRLRNTPIVVFSGHVSHGAVAEKVRAAGGVYLEKPSDIEGFVKVIEDCLRTTAYSDGARSKERA